MEGIWPGHGFVPAHYISTRANTERIYLKVKIIMIWEVLIIILLSLQTMFNGLEPPPLFGFYIYIAVFGQ